MGCVMPYQHSIYSSRRVMDETCDECGRRLRSSLALVGHRGSRPCQLGKTQRMMAARGWAMCSAADAERALVLCDIEYEKAPGEFHSAGMKHAQTHSGKPKKYFDTGLLVDAFWCPAWAVPFVDYVDLDPTYRARIVNMLGGNKAKLAALTTAMALGDAHAVLVSWAEGSTDAD